MRSIRARLNTTLGVSLVLTLLIIGLMGSYGMRLVVEQWLLTRLDHDAESLLVGLTVDAKGRVALSSSFQDPIYRQPFSGHYYQIDSEHQRIRSRSLWDAPFQVPRAELGEVLTLRMTGPEGQLLLLRVAGYEKAGQVLNIAVAEDLTPLRVSVRRYQGLYLLFSLLVLILLLVIQRRMLGAGLWPLEVVRAQLAELERGQRTTLPETGPEEIEPLVTEVNRLLALLHQRVERSRNSLGNLAHGLKTPLAALQQLVDRAPLAGHPQLQGRFREQIATLQQRVEAELRRARLSGPGYQGSRVDLREALDGLVAVMGSLYRDRTLEIQLEVPAGLSYLADKEDLLELLGNLLDNACKWAGRRVRVSAQGGEALLLRVEDDGPGRSDGELARLRVRGVRVDSDSVPGHGLGLAIVQDIVEQFGGRLRLGRSDALGGFLAEVWLPMDGSP